MKRTFLTLATAVMILGTSAACGRQPEKTNRAEATELVAEPAPAGAEEAIATPDKGVTCNEAGDEAVASQPSDAAGVSAQPADRATDVE